MPDPSAWRVDNKKWSARSFDGFGASLEGGRWNSAGVPVVYASEHLSMAAHEKFVHLPRPLPKGSLYVKYALRFGRSSVTRLARSDLPGDWRGEPVPISTQRIGDAWVTSAKTAILAVPSALYPEETNFVLNPTHPDFLKIKVSSEMEFTFDPRMARPIESAEA